MTLHIGDIATDFQTEIQNGLISLHEWAGSSWVLFFRHPAGFTLVCISEMGRTAQIAGEFEKRNVKPLSLSTETAEEHRVGIKDVKDTRHTYLKFPNSTRSFFRDIARRCCVADIRQIPECGARRLRVRQGFDHPVIH